MSFDEIIRRNDIPALKKLLTRDKCINKTTGDLNNTALHTAAFKGNTEMTNLLLDAGADITSQNKKGYTPAHIAANYGRKEVLKILISRDKSLLERKDISGHSILHIAAWKGQKDVVQLLLKQHVNAAMKNSGGNTAYHLAVLWKRLHILKLLLKYDKKRIEDVNKDGSTLLHIAASKGYDPVTRYLLSHGASYAKKDNFGKTPVQVASVKSQKVFSKYKDYKSIITSCTSGMASLLSAKRYEDNDTALHIMSSFCDSHTYIHQLVRSGSNINIRNDSNKTPLWVAVSSGNATNTSALLIHSGKTSYTDQESGRTVLHVAALNNDIDCLRVLLKYSTNVNAVDNSNETALTYTIKHQSKEGVELVINSGGDSTLKSRNENTPLHLSVIANNRDITEFILTTNPEIVNCQNCNGDTPLIFAVSGNSVPLTKFLLDNEADPFLNNNKGKSAYTIAISSGNESLIALFEHFLKATAKNGVSY